MIQVEPLSMEFENRAEKTLTLFVSMKQKTVVNKGFRFNIYTLFPFVFYLPNFVLYLVFQV